MTKESKNAGDMDRNVWEYRPYSQLDYWLTRAVRRALVIYYTLYHRVETCGTENIPESGAVILASNHGSHLDPPLVGTLTKRHIYYMAKEELFRTQWFGKAIRRFGAFPIRRGQADRRAIRFCRDLLNDGQVLLMFPEGTRSPDGKLHEPQSGISFIIDMMPDTPIVPVFIDGSFESWKPGKRGPRPRKIRVYCGKAFRLSELNLKAEVKKQLYQEIGDEIMSQISAAPVSVSKKTT